MPCVPDILKNPPVSSTSLPRPVQLMEAMSLTLQTDHIPLTAPLNPPAPRPHSLSFPEKSIRGSGLHDAWSKAVSSPAQDNAMQSKTTQGHIQTKAGMSL